MRKIVTEMWDRESAFFDDAPDLPAPKEPEIDRGATRHFTRYAIVGAVVIAGAIGGWATAHSNAVAEVAALEAGARVALDTATAALDETGVAIADVTDPSAVPVALSNAAGVITDLSQSALLLRDVSTTEADPGMGLDDPVADRPAYADAATAATALEDAMSSLLTARLLLDELVELPALSTAPADASEISQQLASAISAARERADRTPEAHPDLETLVHQHLDDLAERAGLYAADLRNGAPVGGHLSALDAQTRSLDAAIEAYVSDGLASLVDLQAAFAAALP